MNDRSTAHRRYEGTCRGVALAVAGLLLMAAFPVASAGAAALVASNFNNSREGWQVAGDATSATPTYFATGGNPGGYISSTDSVVGGVSYWVAPPKFRGDHGAAYGGLLTFALRQSDGSSQFDADDVIIQGDGLTLAHDTAVNPAVAPNWTTYRVRLRPSAVHRHHRQSDARRRKRTSSACSERSTDLRIRAEYRTGDDTDDLDNVRLLPPAGGPA